MEEPGEAASDDGGVRWGLWARAVPTPDGDGDHGLWARAVPTTAFLLLLDARAVPTPARRLVDEAGKEEQEEDEEGILLLQEVSKQIK